MSQPAPLGPKVAEGACPRSYDTQRDHGPAEELHACPFDSDVNNDDTPTCTCCDRCQNECAMDI